MGCPLATLTNFVGWPVCFLHHTPSHARYYNNQIASRCFSWLQEPFFWGAPEGGALYLRRLSGLGQPEAGGLCHPAPPNGPVASVQLAKLPCARAQCVWVSRSHTQSLEQRSASDSVGLGRRTVCVNQCIQQRALVSLRRGWPPAPLPAAPNAAPLTALNRRLTGRCRGARCLPGR